MHYIKLFIYLILPLSFCNCSTWPPHGHGGASEQNLGELIPVEAGHPIKASHGLRFDFQLQKQLLDQLILKGAMLCFPAAVQQAKLKENLSARLLSGGLLHDAQIKILEQRLSLAELERKIDTLEFAQACASNLAVNSRSTTNSDQEFILQLLNSDNQFPHNSWAVNPKYHNNLQRAATLLLKYDNYRLNIYGHTDPVGSDLFNLELAEKRSKSVSDLLKGFGIQEDKINRISKGEHHLLFIGSSDEVHLVNRRVSITLDVYASERK